MVVIQRPEDRASLLARGRPALGCHRLPRTRTNLIVGDIVVEQQPDEQIEQRDLLVGRGRGLRLQLSQLAQRLAVRLTDRLVGAVEDLVEQAHGLVVAEAQQRGVANAIRPAGERRRRRAARKRGELTPTVRGHRLKLPVGCAELAQERKLFQLPDDLRRTRRPGLATQPHEPADAKAHIGHAQRVQRPPRLRVEHRLQALIGVALGARPRGRYEPLERRDRGAQQLAVAQRDRRGPQQRQRRVVLKRMLDEEILDVVDLARIGVAEVRELRGALAVLARRALGRVIAREVLDVDAQLGREPLHAGARCVLELGRDEPQPADRRDGDRGRQPARPFRQSSQLIDLAVGEREVHADDIRVGIVREALPREPLRIAEDAPHQSSTSRPSIAN